MTLGPQDFAGRWRLERQISDRLAGQAGHMQGMLTLRPDGPDRLIYREEGSLQLGDGPVMQATRSYVWQFAGGDVVVTFADGAPFHRFRAAGAVAGSDHPCGADLYRVQYDFRDWPAWRAVWDVTGPRKDYTAESRMMPAA